MDTMIRLENFICESSSLQHCLFKVLLEHMSGERHDFFFFTMQHFCTDLAGVVCLSV